LRGREPRKIHAMRRALVIAVIAVLAFVVAAPAADARPSNIKNVSGEVLGAGGFVLDGSCSLIIYSSSGTYRAKHLGRGTYTLRFCVTVPGSISAGPSTSSPGMVTTSTASSTATCRLRCRTSR
jgi:hypothetical protein